VLDPVEEPLNRIPGAVDARGTPRGLFGSIGLMAAIRGR